MDSRIHLLRGCPGADSAKRCDRARRAQAAATVSLLSSRGVPRCHRRRRNQHPFSREGVGCGERGEGCRTRLPRSPLFFQTAFRCSLTGATRARGFSKAFAPATGVLFNPLSPHHVTLKEKLHGEKKKEGGHGVRRPAFASEPPLAPLSPLFTIVPRSLCSVAAYWRKHTPHSLSALSVLCSLLRISTPPAFFYSRVRVGSCVLASRKCAVVKMSASIKKRKTLTLEDKVAVLDAVAAGEKKKDVAARFGIPASSLSTILNAKDSIRSAVEAGTSGKKKKLKQSTYADVDKAVYTWFMDMRARNVPISGAVLQQKAKDYACILGCDDLKASNGWLQGFKNRYGIVGRMISGESSSADSEGAAAWVEQKLPGILERYEPRDTYNADETALFYEMLPNRTLTLKGDLCHGGKQSKRRLTVLLCVNSDGSDKRVPLVIGKSARPRCFKGAHRMPVTYVANAKAWMTRHIFSDWLKEFDADMKKQGRRICLFVDNCTAHHVEALQLTNIELQYLPANCTSLIQPLDRGIINSVKCSYRRRLIQRLLLDLRFQRETKVDIFRAVEMLEASWRETSADVVLNCFRKARITKEVETAEECPETGEEESSSPPDLAEAWVSLRANGAVPGDVQLCDFLHADDCAVTTEEMSDEALVESVRDQDDEDGPSEVEGSRDLPSAEEVLDAIDVLRRVTGSLDDGGAALCALISCERSVLPSLMNKQQSKITQFFSAK